MRIGKLARATGTSVATIRYYEEIGVLPPPKRQQGDQRRYGEEDVARLGFVRRCRALGFSLNQIAGFAAAARSGASREHCRRTMRTRLDDVRARLKQLAAVEARLIELLEEGEADLHEPCVRLAVLA
jgi:DNA-binding transcriptional MerR regulator